MAKTGDAKEKKGSLIVVGTGIRVVGQMTVEAIAWIKSADRVLYTVDDPISEKVIRNLNPRAESLTPLYEAGKPCQETYEEMTKLIMANVREGYRTCVAFYGHPGVFTEPTHEAIRVATAAGFDAKMLPSVSAMDCLFAELGVDPGSNGIQAYGATDFLVRKRLFDPHAALVLWQVGIIGEACYRPEGYNLAPITLLVEKLLETYPSNHEVKLYEASPLPGFPATIIPLAINDLPKAKILPTYMLYIPPLERARLDPVMLDRVKNLLATSRAEVAATAAKAKATKKQPAKRKRSKRT
jgi:uncharacterized protein YabN with tetrapyrrole methylase and pyrophosphatase domain